MKRKIEVEGRKIEKKNCIVGIRYGLFDIYIYIYREDVRPKRVYWTWGLVREHSIVRGQENTSVGVQDS